ncbi:MAG: FkbM family methyltransferase [Gemmatimonadaceae bacterium]
MSFGRSLLDHAIRYRRFGSFSALGARRGAARRTYGAHALHELLRRSDTDGPGWAHVAGFEMRYLEAEWMRFLYREVFAEREYWFATDDPRPVILDCGSNIGMAILFFKALYPNAQITAFEPAPWACAAIEETLRANDLRGVTLHNAALAETDGTLDLFHDPKHPGSAVMSVFEDRMPGEAVRVPAVRLSSYIKGPISFLKLDVEGSELPVLRDLVTTGAISQISQMVIEFHHHMSPDVDNMSECLGILERHGFGYQLSSGQVFTPITRGQFQDVLIHAYRKDVAPTHR